MARYEICPKCSSEMLAESLGWVCKKCLTFLDMHGVCHELTEKPFAPPLTNGDKIRAMSDEELADFLSLNICQIIKGSDTPFCNGWCDQCISEWLRQPAEEA